MVSKGAMGITSFLLICLLVAPTFVVQAVTEPITVDGNLDDWVAMGLTPVGTDPPYNIKSYHDMCADMLEAWFYSNANYFYFMIKVRGGYPADWDINNYQIALDTDQNVNTGDQMGWDYVVAGTKGIGALMTWNAVTLYWDVQTAVMKAGDTGYIEWRIPSSQIKTTGEIDAIFLSRDALLSDVVNTITVPNLVVNNNPPPTPTPTPSPTPTPTPSPTPSQTQTSQNGVFLPIEWIYAAVAATVLVIIIAVGFMFKSRRTRNFKQSTS